MQIEWHKENGHKDQDQFVSGHGQFNERTRRLLLDKLIYAAFSVLELSELKNVRFSLQSYFLKKFANDKNLWFNDTYCLFYKTCIEDVFKYF